MDITNIRSALLISLSIFLVVILWRRFRQRVVARDLPALSHLELLQLQVAYHPARLSVEVSVPSPQTLQSHLLDAQHRLMHSFHAEELRRGKHWVSYELPSMADGTYHLQLDTGTQRTVRQFRLRST